MVGHNICFNGEIWLNVPKLSLLTPLIDMELCEIWHSEGHVGIQLLYICQSQSFFLLSYLFGYKMGFSPF